MSLDCELPCHPALIAIDWGSTSLRAYALDVYGQLCAQSSSDLGVLTLRQQTPAPKTPDFAQALVALCGDWLALAPHCPLIACGMIGSSLGWREVPYCPTPASLADVVAARASVQFAHHTAHDVRSLTLVPGLLCNPIVQGTPTITAAAHALPNVMRGEETQILGAMAYLQQQTKATDRAHSAEPLLIGLPGTHSKWMSVKQGQLGAFETYMTGELFALLQHHSILGQGMSPEPHTDDAAFALGIQVAQSEPHLLAQLFSCRALGLTQALTPSAIRDYLSGLLIGHELVAVLRRYGSAADSAIVLCGAPALCARYALALKILAQPEPQCLTETSAWGLWSIAQAAGLVAHCA